MAIILVLAASILLQLIAAFLALRLISVTDRRAAWISIAGAVTLMALRRIITLFRVVSGDVSHPPDLSAELVALVISVLMVAGIARVVPPLPRYSASAETAAGERGAFPRSGPGSGRCHHHHRCRWANSLL